MSKKLLYCFLTTIIIITGCRKNAPDEGGIDQITTINFSLATALQSGMVLQRDKPIQIWGRATTGNKVTIKTSWGNTIGTTIADENGNWKVSLPATVANNQPQTLTCTTDGADAITLSDLLIGDVWLCAGQSNMVMQVDAIAPFKGVLNYTAEIAAANYPDIRVLTILPNSQAEPVLNLANSERWLACSTQTVGNTSAVAYFFASKLHTTLNVPVGIIVAGINGSWCESWVSKEAFTAYPEISRYAGSGTGYYNGMISPFTNMAIKGFIWYQGENNQHDTPSDYTKINSALIKNWRTVFNQPDLPFYLTQLTPFAENYLSTTPAGGSLTANWLAYFREAQSNVLAIPNTGMAITMDVGEAADHHPRNKRPVGERLALLALKNTYQQNVSCDGPKYAYYNQAGNTATIIFANNTAKGLNTIANEPLKQLFFVAGTDKVFRQGLAQISGSTIVLTTPPATPLPILSIRYAFTNAAVTNLQNDSGLPMEPFRTDNW